MNSICSICKSEKRYDGFRKLYKPLDLCNTRRALKNYYNNRDRRLEKKRNYYYNDKEYLHDYNKKRKSKIYDLENQI